MKYTEHQILDYDPFFGDEGELSLHTKKLVKVRKQHSCFFGLGSYANKPNHKIEIGDPARFEKALVDGDYFGRYYMCIPCLEKEIDVVYYAGEEYE